MRPRRGRPCGRGRGHRGDGACLEEGALRAGGRGLRSEPCWAARGGRWPWPWQRRRQEEKPQRRGLGGARPRPPGPSPRAWEAMKLGNGRDHRGSAVGGGGGGGGSPEPRGLLLATDVSWGKPGGPLLPSTDGLRAVGDARATPGTQPRGHTGVSAGCAWRVEARKRGFREPGRAGPRGRPGKG